MITPDDYRENDDYAENLPDIFLDEDGQETCNCSGINEVVNCRHGNL